MALASLPPTRETNRRFQHWVGPLHWQRAEVGRHTTDCKIISLPDVETITFDRDRMTVLGYDLKLIVYSAAGNSPDQKNSTSFASVIT